MSENTAVDTISGLDYEEIEEAVMETARGRWFLTEFARRQRGSDTKLLLDAIRRLEDQLLTMPVTSGVSSSVGHLVEEAEDELKRLSGSGDAPADGSLNARDLAERLAAITGSLRSAVDAPAETIAARIRPEIDRLDACASQQDELAGKLNRAAQMVRRLRSSDVITDDGVAAKPEKQLSAPQQQPNPAPQQSSAAAPQRPPVQAIQPKPTPAKAAPAFVPSDDDIFENNDKPLSTSGSAKACGMPAARPAKPAAAKLPDVSSDTLNFADIDVPPLPDRVSDDDTSEAAGEVALPANELNSRTKAAENPKAAPDDDDLPPEPNLGADQQEPATQDRVIQVTRSSGNASQPTAPGNKGIAANEALSGRINLANPLAANQTAATVSAPAHAAASGAPGTGSQASSSGQKKRIIVIRRPADGADDIPLAGEAGSTGPDAPGAA